jgi:hypothetical protein
MTLSHEQQEREETARKVKREGIKRKRDERDLDGAPADPNGEVIWQSTKRVKTGPALNEDGVVETVGLT